VPLAEPALTRHVFALFRSDSQDSPPVKAVLDAMAETAVAGDSDALP
jgi:hypothetical protein